MSVLNITEENFQEEVLNSKVPVLVDFWAEWCGPCKMQAPLIEELAEEMTNVKFGKVNVDDEFNLARQFEILSIPTLMVFDNGEVKSIARGVQPKNDIINMLNA